MLIAKIKSRFSLMQMRCGRSDDVSSMMTVSDSSWHGDHVENVSDSSPVFSVPNPALYFVMLLTVFINLDTIIHFTAYSQWSKVIYIFWALCPLFNVTDDQTQSLVSALIIRSGL